MQKHKYFSELFPNGVRYRRITKDQSLIVFYIAMLVWLFAASYALGEFEIKQAELVLNQEGCIHLMYAGVTSEPHKDVCRASLPFRPNFIDAGGRIYVAGRTIRLPERQLISATPLARQPWTSRQYGLVGLVVICTLLVIGAMWLSERCRRREVKSA